MYTASYFLQFQAYKSDWNMKWHQFSEQLVTLVLNNKTTFPVLSLLLIVIKLPGKALETEGRLHMSKSVQWAGLK